MIRFFGVFAAVSLLALPLSGVAQTNIDESRLPEPWLIIETDVTGDGKIDVLTSTPHSFDLDIVTLFVDGQYAPFVLPVSTNRTGEPGIAITSNTTFDIRTGCFACGRYHSETLWRMAWRNDDLIVAGYTETTVDRTRALVIMCDVNLLTGYAEIKVDGELRASSKMEPVLIPSLDLVRAARPRQCDATSQFEDN